MTFGAQWCTTVLEITQKEGAYDRTEHEISESLFADTQMALKGIGKNWNTDFKTNRQRCRTAKTKKIKEKNMEQNTKKIAEWVETLIRVRDKEGLTWQERDILAEICNFLDAFMRGNK